MSLSAFTNQVGHFVRYENRIGDGVDWNLFRDPHALPYPAFRTSVPVEESHKPPPQPGDFKRAYNYSRFVKKVTQDSPGSFFDRTYLGNPAYLWHERTEPYYLSNEFGLSDFSDWGSLENSVSESVTEALNDLSGSYAGVGADLGQARQTLDSLASLSEKILHCFRAARVGDVYGFIRGLSGLTGKPINIRSLQKSISDIWLEYAYGWKPIANDIYELDKLVRRDLVNAPIVRGSGYGVENKSRTIPRYNASGAVHMTASIKASAKTVLFGKISSPLLYQLNSAGLLNPLAIAWELVPWSFVLDWFAPIGQTLQAATAGFGLEPLGGWTSIQHKGKTLYTVNPFYDDHLGYRVVGYSGGELSIESFSFTRIARTTFPWPKLYADVTPYSTPRAINALALLRQRV